MVAGRRANLLDSSVMLPLLLPGWMDADPSGGLY